MLGLGQSRRPSVAARANNCMKINGNGERENRGVVDRPKIVLSKITKVRAEYDPFKSTLFIQYFI